MAIDSGPIATGRFQQTDDFHAPRVNVPGGASASLFLLLPKESLAQSSTKQDHVLMSESTLSCSTSKIETALQQAEAHCESRGAKFTPIRRRVLELLLIADGPAKAYDLLNQLNGDGAAKPPTIYRALDFLLDMGLAHKIESLNSFVVCGHSDHNHAAAFLICELCDSAKELPVNRTLETLSGEVERVDFKIQSAVLEVRGVCTHCRSNS